MSSVVTAVAEPLRKVEPPVWLRRGLLISQVPWSDYEDILRIFEDRHLRITYDRGELEITTVSSMHERLKKLLARLIEAMVLELRVPMLALGNMTCRNADMLRGLEPDECYYIQHEAQMRNRDEIDLATDPPPDLAIEVEVTVSALPRMDIYRQLGIPEVWRFDGESLHVHLLKDEVYTASSKSQGFPELNLRHVTDALKQRGTVDDTQLLLSFCEALRQDRGRA